MRWSHGSHRRTLVARAHDRERGAVLALVALCLTVLVTAVAFTVDLGRISTTRRDLQKTADVVALDLARRIESRPTSAIVADPSWVAAYQASMTRNGVDPVDGVWEVGNWDARTETWSPTGAAEVPSAVRVTITGTISYQFAPGGATTSRLGVAAVESPSASFHIGSYAARVDSAVSPVLGPLLGEMLGVTAGGYEGLVGGEIGLDALGTALGIDVGTPDELASASFTLAELLQAQADVFRASGDVMRADLLDQIRLSLPTPGVPVELGDLVSIVAGSESAAAAATIDAFDLLTAAAFVVNGDRFLDLPGVDIGVPGLATTTAEVRVIERPRLVAGPIGTSGSTGQVTVNLEVEGSLPPLAELEIGVNLVAAPATGTMEDIRCRSPLGLDLGVATSLISTTVDIRFDLSLPLLFGELVVARPHLRITSGAGAQTAFRAFDFPPDAFGDRWQVPTSGLNLGGAQVNVVDVGILPDLPIIGGLNDLIAPVLDEVVNGLTLGQIVGGIDGLVLTPLLDALGVSVASADVTPRSVTDCGGIALVG